MEFSVACVFAFVYDKDFLFIVYETSFTYIATP